MNRTLLLACVAVLSACSRQQPSPAATDVTPPVGTGSANAPAASADAASAPASDPAAFAQASLDRMDTRAPVPLLPMMANHQKQSMREHLAAVQQMVASLATDDFAGVEQAAGRIGFSEQMGQMCTHMGAAAPGFTEQALEFHHTADRIAAAAKRHDAAQVLSALAATLATCTGCHTQWKQQVVDESNWERLAAAPAPMMHHMQ